MLTGLYQGIIFPLSKSSIEEPPNQQTEENIGTTCNSFWTFAILLRIATDSCKRTNVWVSKRILRKILASQALRLPRQYGTYSDGMLSGQEW